MLLIMLIMTIVCALGMKMSNNQQYQPILISITRYTAMCVKKERAQRGRKIAFVEQQKTDKF